jgi:nicotinate-nucleotide--dimethylbenzimidazole phosphoribosyltransferase
VVLLFIWLPRFLMVSNRRPDPMDVFAATLQRIAPLDRAAMEAAAARQAQLTKPAGSLGRLESLSIQLAGIQARPLPSIASKAVLTLAADHGVAAEGVSRYPQAVTQQMVLNFLRGGAAINVLARAAGARVVVADFGVIGDLAIPSVPADDVPDRRQVPLPAGEGRRAAQGEVRFLPAKLAPGTDNLAAGPAMSRDLAMRAIEHGIALVGDECARGLDAVATGEMGIGNTTPASCIAAALTGASIEVVTGRGTGLDDAQLAHKRTVIARALAVNRPDPADPLDVLAKVGGLEIAGLVGVMLGAAARRVAVVVDGFISGAAALVAARLCPTARDYMIAAHRSVEPGHAVILDALDLQPLLDLQLRLGEGTGAALAFPLLEAACRILSEMATFADAGVAGPAS